MRLSNGTRIGVCNKLIDTQSLFDYGIQLMESYDNEVKDKNRLFIGQYYWFVDRYEDFVNISYLMSSNDMAFEATFRMGFY
jgi:hypothetical protein